MTQALSILFVCKGNICRSPTAEGVMLHRIRALGLGDRFLIDSAGTRDWFDGKPPHPPTVVAAGKRGYDLSSLRGRGVVVGDFERFDRVYCMDQENLAELRQICPQQHRSKIRLLTELLEDPEFDHVPDPYGGIEADYELVLDLVERGVQVLVSRGQGQGLDGESSSTCKS